MNKLDELNGLLKIYMKEHLGQNPELIVLGNGSMHSLMKLQQNGFVQLEFNYETNGKTFGGIRVLVSNENNHEEISFY